MLSAHLNLIADEMREENRLTGGWHRVLRYISPYRFFPAMTHVRLPASSARCQAAGGSRLRLLRDGTRWRSGGPCRPCCKDSDGDYVVASIQKGQSAAASLSKAGGAAPDTELTPEALADNERRKVRRARQRTTSSRRSSETYATVWALVLMVNKLACYNFI